MLFDLKLLLRRYRLAHSALHLLRYLLRPDYRDVYRELRSRLDAWTRSSGGLMQASLGNGSRGQAVFFGWSRFEHVLAESALIKSFECADFEVHVITDPTPDNALAYAAIGITGVESFCRYMPFPERREAASIVDGLKSFEDLIEFHYEGVAVGKYASSTLMRSTRKGNIDVADTAIRDSLVRGLASSLAAVRGATAMLRRLQPKAVVLVDRGYTPYGEVFDVCVNNGVQVITWNVAHRDNTLMLKRYGEHNRLAHPSSLSPASWEILKTAPWSDAKRAELETELEDSYHNGEWYGEVGTQFGKRDWNRDEVVRKFSLDPQKPIAVIYSHIFWDATFFWGVDLFRDYEDWFVQTVRAACANDKLNWLIKVHPANSVKDRRDGVTSDPSEMIALREQVGALPDHVKIIPPDEELTTLSLFRATDFCLTVRGTVGIEAALFGNVVLTAGTGRYDRHGFTRDFDSKPGYLEYLAQLEESPALSEREAQLAQIFAYGIFICRPVRLSFLKVGFQRDEVATMQVALKVRTREELENSKDIAAIADWLAGDDEDLLCLS